MSELLTNYLDDILAETMNGKRKYRITHSNGLFEDVTIEDVSEYEQIGSNFGAGDINKTNQAVNEKFDSGDVVDPMLTTEPGFAADAYQTKLQFDEQNKNINTLNTNKADKTTVEALSKNSIRKYDYNNIVTLGAITSYTATTDGLLICRSANGANNYGYIGKTINGTHIELAMVTSSGTYAGTCSLPVSVGDTFTVKCANAYFVPCV